MNTRHITEVFANLKNDGLAFYPEKHIAPFTTMGVGGPADMLVMADTSERLSDALMACNRHNLSYKVLGCGSNVIVAERFPLNLLS